MRGEAKGVRHRQAPYLSVLNFLLFFAFMGCIWIFALKGDNAQIGSVFGATEIQMLMLQSVSLLMLVGAIQLPMKNHKMWRACLVALSFLALSEACLVALLTPA